MAWFTKSNTISLLGNREQIIACRLPATHQPQHPRPAEIQPRLDQGSSRAMQSTSHRRSQHLFHSSGCLTRRASNALSVAGMIASVDKWLGQWPADLRIQESRREIVSELDSMLKSRLHLWKKQGKHKIFSNNLLVYRDGLSEGQYAIVIDTELPLLRKAYAELYPPPDTKKGLPHITIIIVGKRHHTRFYPTTTSDADRSSNLKNGTVIDRGVIEARNWDFFLQSHTALQSIAWPAHYYIVLDEIFTKRRVPPPFQNVADVLEDLTNSICYLFGGATKAVSICPPAYYADIVCERARCYLNRLFDAITLSGTPAQSVLGDGGHPEARTEDVLIHPNLRNTMFFI